MFRRVSSNVVQAKTPLTKALVPVNQKRDVEVFSTWWAASWVGLWQWNMLTFFPILAAEWVRPSYMYNKLPMYYYFHEKKQEQKLRSEMDSVYTKWDTSLDRSAVDDAISRTF